MNLRQPPHPGTRDVAATSFSRHLDLLINQVPEALCAVFIDGEGETVDFSSRLDHFDARIAGAELAIVMSSLRRSNKKLSHGETLEIRIEGGERSFLARHVSEGYDLMLVVRGATISARTAELAAGAAHAILVESGLKPPASTAMLRSVEKRPSRMGIAVPTAFEENGKRRRVEAILGVRTEDGEVKFLVRLDDGEELVVVHEQQVNRWRRA